MLAVVLPILWIGLYPEALLRRIEPSVIELIEQVERGNRDAALGRNSKLAVALPLQTEELP
jgi:NADH:ubiquinone oxidoreductase subunit 4 (subunit M)